MLASRLARTTISNVLTPKVNRVTLIYRNINTQPKESFFKRRGLRGAQGSGIGATSELSHTPISIGQGFLAGASVLGLGSLVFYGLGFGKEAGFLERSTMWPSYVRERISSTYQYFGASLGITAASAVAAARSPVIMNLVSRNSMMAMFGFFALTIGSGMVARSIPYEKGTFGSKQVAWAAHAGILGAFLASLTFLGRPALIRAAWYTAGISGGLSIVAATAPSEKFLNMGGPLAIGMGTVFAASIGSAFLPPTTRLGLSLYSVAMYGGLVLFSMFLLYDTQKIVKKSEHAMHYDPVNESISIYLDVLNIFIRLAILMSGSNRRK